MKLHMFLSLIYHQGWKLTEWLYSYSLISGVLRLSLRGDNVSNHHLYPLLNGLNRQTNFFKGFIYLFLESGEGKERGKNINV